MNSTEILFDWFLSATMRGTFLAISVILLQTALGRHLPALWRYALWLPVIFVLGAPMLPESALSLENRFGKTFDSVVVDATPAAAIPLPDTIPTLRPLSPAMDWKAISAVIWLAGAMLTLMLGIAAYLRTTRRLRQTALPEDRSLRPELNQAAQACGLRKVPPALISRKIHSPAVTGFFRPRLLLPAGFATTFDRKERHLILLHEMMHLKRADLLVNWLLFALQALHWCNPVVWVAFARMRTDRETACDSAVLAASQPDSRSTYGHALLKLESGTGQSLWNLCFVGIFERGSTLRSRVRAIATYRRTHPAWAIPGAGLIVALGLAGATRAQSGSVGATEPGKEILIEARFIEVPADTRVEILSERAELNQKGGFGVCVQDPETAETFFTRLTQQPGVDLLSAPKVVTRSGEQAAIEIGQEVKAGAGPLRKVGVSLGVVPTLTDQGIDLAMKATSTRMIDAATGAVISAAPSDDKVEFLETRVDSKVSIKQGQTIVFIMAEPNRKIKPARRLLITISARHSVPSVSEQPIEVAKAFPAADAMATKLQGLIIPQMEFHNATLSDAVAFLQIRSRQLDPDKKGINIIIAPEAAKTEAKITLSLKDIPLSEALRYVAELSGLAIGYEKDAVRLQLMKVQGEVAAPTSPFPKPKNATTLNAERIIFPKVEFHESSLSDVVAFLRIKSLELDKEKKGVNLIITPEAARKAKETKITLSLTNIPLATILNYLSNLAGLTIQYDEHTIWLR